MLKVLLQLMRSRTEDLNLGRLAPKPSLNSGESGKELVSHVSVPGIFLVSNAFLRLSFHRPVPSAPRRHYSSLTQE